MSIATVIPLGNHFHLGKYYIQVMQRPLGYPHCSTLSSGKDIVAYCDDCWIINSFAASYRDKDVYTRETETTNNFNGLYGSYPPLDVETLTGWKIGDGYDCKPATIKSYTSITLERGPTIDATRLPFSGDWSLITSDEEAEWTAKVHNIYLYLGRFNDICENQMYGDKTTSFKTYLTRVTSAQRSKYNLLYSATNPYQFQYPIGSRYGRKLSDIEISKDEGFDLFGRSITSRIISESWEWYERNPDVK